MFGLALILAQRKHRRRGWSAHSLRASPTAPRESPRQHTDCKTSGCSCRLAVRFNRRRQSNDHCEQFDQSDSNHQHRDCYRIVIEPMPLLYIRDTPPCSSNLTTYAHRCRTDAARSMLFLRIELLDERSDMRGDGSREGVVLHPQAVPERQPDASIANKGRPISRGPVHLRLVRTMRSR
jgi:hypothetical protein